MEEVEDPHDFCIACVEIAAIVDISHSLITETYICESKQPGAFTVWEGLSKLRAMFGHGIDGFDAGNHFVELDKRAKEAAKTMQDKFIVSFPVQIMSRRSF